MVRSLGLLVLCLFVPVHQLLSDQPARYFTGNPRADLFPPELHHREDIATALHETQPGSNAADDMAANHKSPWLAAGLSLAIPGAGEFYSESYLRSGLFFAAEVAAWVVAYVYDKKGDRQTDLFQAFADDHWSVVEYANWLVRKGYSIRIEQDPNLRPWLRVNWDDLNRAEGQVQGFSHRLPPYGDQQYYEVIGKYVQYSPGWWEDFDPSSPELRGSPRFYNYAGMRKKANDFYDVANISLSIIVVNHVLSAIDAYLATKSYNNRIGAEARLNMRPTPWGSIAEPTATLSFKF